MSADKLLLPRDLKGAGCVYLEVCARLQGVEQNEKPLNQKIAGVRVGRVAGYLRLLRGGKISGHLHVDLALALYFPGTKPEVNSDRKAIEREISRHYGRKANLAIVGQYVTPVNEITPGAGVVFAGPAAVISTVENAAIEVDGAHLVVRNDGFVRFIDWQRYGDEAVFVDIYAQSEIEISPSYLSEVFARLNKAHSTDIRGKIDDAPREP
jgi:hypothetical protein